MQKWRILTTKTHLSTVLEAFPEDSNQSKWMWEMWVDGGTAAWLASLLCAWKKRQKLETRVEGNKAT
jgi:hypothetical protein